MKEITDLSEKQRVALNVLIFFKEFCESHNIRFFLAYGTLLGAVRHNGFIPWDDDVDVMLLRDDYYKFIKVWSNEAHPFYKFVSMDTNKDYFAPLAKMYDNRTLLVQEYGQIEKEKYGIYIDIYVIDKLPDNYSDAATLYSKSQKIRKQWGMAVRKFSAPSRSFVKKICRIPYMAICKLYGTHYFMRKYNQLAQSYKNLETHHLGIIIYGEGISKEYFSTSMFIHPAKVSFEGTEFLAPTDVDKYLTQMYGDYMKLPPVEERKVHPNKTYWI